MPRDSNPKKPSVSLAHPFTDNLTGVSQIMNKEIIEKYFYYCYESGNFIWKVNRGNGRKNSPAGNLRSDGYLRIQLFGKNYYAHVLVWVYFYGKFSDFDIDHIDGNRANNKIQNLREATRNQNCQNQKKQNKNKKIKLGVTLKDNKYFVARIRKDGVLYNIGSYKTEDDAYKAYLKKKREIHEYCTI